MYRRQFLYAMASATGGLLLGCASSRRPGGVPFAPSPFLRIDPDGSEPVTVARADLDARCGDQFAGGSAVVRTSWDSLRNAGATPRTAISCRHRTRLRRLPISRDGFHAA